MAPPTAQVISNAQRLLGEEHDVVLALRVEWGPNVIDAHRRRSFWTAGTFPPLVALVGLRDTIRRIRLDRDSGVGILALTRDEGRVLLSARPLQRKWPTGIIETLPASTPMSADVELMETHLIPSLTVGDREFVVNGVDFKKLLDAVENRTIRSPEIKAVMPRLRDVGVGYPIRGPDGDTDS